MAINPDAVGIVSDPVERSWTSNDALLYALSVGAGADDPTGSELKFTTENTSGVTQAVLPTYAVILGSAVGGLSKHFGTYDKAKLVHAEQWVELHAPLPATGTLTARASITGVWDKGTAAVIETTTAANDATAGQPLFTTRNRVFIRGEGGWGGARGPSSRHAVPDRAADITATCQTRPDQALLYRLNGDHNPLHSDPTFAARGGFDRPILHGLCTFGFTGRVLLRELCDLDPRRFASMSARFSWPVLPGDALTVEVWRDEPGTASFRTKNGRGDVVIDGGVCRYTA